MKHKHYDMILAWAEGKQIQIQCLMFYNRIKMKDLDFWLALACVVYVANIVFWSLYLFKHYS